jgi:putative membrane protein
MRSAYDDPYRRGLAAAFLLVWLALAIDPVDRVVWALENILVATLLGLLYAYRHEAPLSRGACLCVFAFLCVHEVGAHYTYPGVPYDAWALALVGVSPGEALGLERNHFDRLIHFLFGLLLTGPMREVLLRTSPVRRGWSYVLPVALSMAASSGYEVVEWLAVVAFGGDSGMAFIGAQGDVWDAQKDMALAGTGATLAMALVAYRERRRAPGRVHAGQVVGGGGRLARAG